MYPVQKELHYAKALRKENLVHSKKVREVHCNKVQRLRTPNILSYGAVIRYSP